MKEKPGWKYQYSNELEQMVALHKASGWLFCEDGTKYSPEELQVLRDKKQKMSLQAHLLKKVFDGKLVKDGETK